MPAARHIKFILYNRLGKAIAPFHISLSDTRQKYVETLSLFHYYADM